MDLDFEIFRWIQVHLRSPWLDPVGRVLADSGLGQVQFVGLIWVVWARNLTLGQRLGVGVLLVGGAAASTFAEASTISGLTTGIAALLLIYFSRFLEKREAILAMISGATAGLVRLAIVRLWISRPRPSNLEFVTPIEEIRAATSFPSGHSTTAAAVGVVIALCAWNRDRRISIGALIYVALVGFSRLYNGVHYPTDVLAGWMLGAFFAALVVWLADKKAIRTEAEGVQ